MMQVVQAGNGWLWLKQGAALYRRDATGWLMLVLAFLMVSAAFNLIPVAGPFIASALLPGLSMGLMQACQDGQAGRALHPRLLFAALVHRTDDLLRMGLVYLAAMLAALALAAPVDDGILLRQMLLGTAPAEEAVRDGRYLNALALSGLLASPVLMCFWFAPMLLYWRGLGIAQSLFYSFFATLRNWRVFAVYGLLLFCTVMLVSLAIASIGVSMGGTPAAMRGAMLALIILAMPVITASFYFSYQDIFPPPADLPASDENPHTPQV